MKIILNTFITGLAMLGMFGIQAEAATVKFEPDLSMVAPLDVLDLNMVGSDFATNIDAGDFSVSWDPAVLGYTSFTEADPPWDVVFDIDDMDAEKLGKLSVAIGTLEAAGVNGPDFDIGTLTFNVIGPVGSNTIVSAADRAGWTAPVAQRIDVTYNDATVKVVPVPAALWLFGSGLLGFMVVARKRNSA